MKKNSTSKIFVSNLNPKNILKIIEPDDFEEIINEWLQYRLREKYLEAERVEKVGGSGDMGRDIICTIDKDRSIWDNYQCKRYNKPISFSEAIIEIGKLCYYSFKQEYSVPRSYFFFCSQDLSTNLRDLLNNKSKLKEKVITDWNKCSKKIIKGKNIELEGEFRKYLENFDFNIFDYITTDEFLEDFKKTPYYTTRFGRLEKVRPLSEETPDEIQVNEMTYIKKILDAYSDYLKENISTIRDIEGIEELKTDLNNQRKYFFSAEALKAFSREIYPPELNYYEKLEEDIYYGIIDEIKRDAKNGFDRLKKILSLVTQIQLNENPLNENLNMLDKKGICHQLANLKKEVKWKNE